MKIFPLLLLATCVPTLSHAQTDAPAMPATPRADVTQGALDAYQWRFAPPVGSRWTMRSFQRNDVKQLVPAIADQGPQKLDISGFTRSVADYDVMSRDALGATTIRVTYRDLVVHNKTTINGKAVTGAATTTNFKRAIAGASFSIKQAPDGAVWNIIGLDEVQKRLLDAGDYADASERAAAQKLVASFSSSAAIRKIMEDVSGVWPKYPVRVSESWDYIVDLSQGLPVQLKSNGHRTLKALDKETATVAESLKYDDAKLNLSLPTGSNGGNLVISTSDLKGNIEGYSRVQRSSGLTLRSSLTQNLSANIGLKAPVGAGQAPLNLRVPMNATIEIRTVLEPR